MFLPFYSIIFSKNCETMQIIIFLNDPTVQYTKNCTIIGL